MMIKCNICGHEFAPLLDNHYVSRDCGKSGVVTVITDDEGKHYDTFDCPACGCQHLAQERKRTVIPCFVHSIEEENDEAFDEAETD